MSLWAVFGSKTVGVPSEAVNLVVGGLAAFGIFAALCVLLTKPLCLKAGLSQFPAMGGFARSRISGHLSNAKPRCNAALATDRDVHPCFMRTVGSLVSVFQGIEASSRNVRRKYVI
jgi:hypothetical protein